MSRRPARLALRCALPLLLACSTAFADDDQQRVAREMIQALDAYAVYKMGQFEEAYARFLKLAEAGNRQGMLNTGNMLAAGLGVTQNHAEALKWYRRAAEAGDPIGIYEVGKAHEQGLGVVADREAALDWYRRAADLDSVDAQWALGKHLYDQGERLAGLSWIRTAAFEGGSPEARAFLDALEGTGKLATTPGEAEQRAVLETLAAIDAAAQRKDASGIVAALQEDASIRVRLPDTSAWQTLSRTELAALWQATFDQVEGYRYERAQPELLAADGGVLAVSRISEQLESAGEVEELVIHESALLHIVDGKAQVHSLRMDIRRNE